MALRTLIGAPNTGKTGVIHALLRERALHLGTAALLLPSPADVARTSGELARECTMGLSIATLGGYLDGLWRSAGDGRRLITAAERSVILAESASSVEPGVLRDSASAPGFAKMLESLVRRAAENTVRFEAARSSRGAGGRLLAYAEAYFKAARTAGLVERGEAYRLLAARVGDLVLPDLIAVNRFTGFTPSQERFLVAASGSADVEIALTFDAQMPATEAAQALVTRLAGVGSVEAVGAGRTFSACAELAALEQGYCRPGAASSQSDGAVVFSEAWGARSEASRIVREVADVIDAGVEPGRIAVVFRDPAAHVRTLAPALAEAGLAVDWDLQVPFERTGLGRAVLALLRVGAGAADRVTWMELMRSPYSPGDQAALDELDAAWRSGRGPAAPGGMPAHRVPGDVSSFQKTVRRACEALGGEASALEWHRMITGMVGRAHPPGETLTPEGLLDCAAARVVGQAVAGVCGVPGARVSPATLSSALRGSPVSVTGSRNNHAIQVMSAERIRGRRFACVVVGGLNAGEFPRSDADEGFGAHGAAGVLASAGIEVARGGGVATERLLFYQVITRASQRLVLSWQSHDALGRPRQPSVFLDEVLDLYGGVGDDGRGDGRLPWRTLGLRSVTTDGAAGASDPCDRSCADVSGVGLEEGSRAGATAASASAARRRGTWLQEIGSRETFSVSDIETYLQCPYRWFIERIVRPGSLDSQVNGAAAGRLAHAVMSTFYERFQNLTGQARVTPGTVDAALGVHREVAAALLEKIPATTSAEAALLERTVRRTASLLERDAALLPGLVPVLTEWAFGLDGDDPEPCAGVGLSGRVDRIDADDSRLVVTDYKLGAIGAEHGVARMEESGLVQLPLYAAVASRRLGLAIAGGVYRSLAGTSPRGFVRDDLAGPPFTSTDTVDDAAILGLLERTWSRAQDALNGMRAGRIPAAPSSGACPGYCLARPFCDEWRAGSVRS